jgi:RNA polymerase sigma factor for flagellar operon FliA
VLPKHVDIDDRKSAGQFGLYDAIEKYDPKRGYKFETYAINRIRGAILDDLRSLDWVPRSVRSKERQIEQAVNDLTQELGRSPTIEELCDLLDMDEAEVKRGQSAGGTVFNIDTPIDHESEMTVADLLSVDVGDLSEAFAIFDVTKMLDAIASLPERERLTIALHYYLGYTLAEIGRKFDVTESRVCQIHTRALKVIRKDLLS